jgi:alpha-L-rhamnosidase
MWDSGKVLSGNSIHILYKGRPLKSNSQYRWEVTVWDADGDHCSKTSEFGTALLNEADWKACWIGFNEAPEPIPPKGFFTDPEEGPEMQNSVMHLGRSVLLRKGFEIKKNVRSAKLYITGLGFYEAEINGCRVGNHVLAPAKTPYHKYVLYDSYDVTDMLAEGENAIGIHLGNGWYNPYKQWWNTYRMQWFGYKKAIAQLMITYADGTHDLVVTGKSWKRHLGPVLYNCIYDGEVYDANEEIEGWGTAGFNDDKWADAVEMKSPAPLVSSVMPPIAVVDTLNPVKITEPEKGVRVFDMGQNFAGWVKVILKGEKGSKIKIQFSEELTKDGTLDLTCNENAKATAVYILKGAPEETYEPGFTYFGFRYASITSDTPMPEIISLKGCVAHSGNMPAGRFKCSYPLINKMHHAAVWSQKSNMIGYPMDCPQRDERLGWMGDAQVTAEEAMFNFNMALFYKNWFHGIRENQDEKTGDIPIISPRP